MAYETIEFKLVDGVARLTLNRPDRLNSFTVQMHEEVADALGRLEGARTLILTGAGRGFCAGQDGDRQWSRARRGTSAVGGRSQSVIRPCLAADAGDRTGERGGRRGARQYRDRRELSSPPDAKFIQAFAAIGLIPDSGGTWVLPRLVGRRGRSAWP